MEFLVYSSSDNIVVACLMIEVILYSVKQTLTENFAENEVDSKDKWFGRETDPIRMNMIKAKLFLKAFSCLGVIM